MKRSDVTRQAGAMAGGCLLSVAALFSPMVQAEYFDYQTTVGGNTYWASADITPYNGGVNIELKNLLDLDSLVNAFQYVSRIGFSVTGATPLALSDKLLATYVSGSLVTFSTGGYSTGAGPGDPWYYGKNAATGAGGQFGSQAVSGNIQLSSLFGNDKTLIAPSTGTDTGTTFCSPTCPSPTITNFVPAYDGTVIFQLALAGVTATSDIFDVSIGFGTAPGSKPSEPDGFVPIPAAVWLFGSGLLGLIGIARRKQVGSAKAAAMAAA